jgi:adenosylmethionine-8-amino-7-oxononanoate aminotransferase
VTPGEHPADTGAGAGETSSTGDATGTSGTRAQWLERDEAVVWHGFTQMAHYAEHAPVVVDRAEGHELVDVDGRRYLDAISSLWVTTLGHRVPELDEALRRQLDAVAHSTMLGNTNRVVVELAEELARVVPVDEPHFLFASDGAAAVEQALKMALQYWVNSGVHDRTRYLALGNAYHGDTVGSLSLGDGGFGTSLFDPLRFPVVRTPGYDDPSWLDKALATLDAHAGELAAVVVEPLVQGAAGMLVADPDDVGALGRAARDAGILVVADEVATGFGRTGRLFASEWCGLRPDLLCLGKGITGGYLPMSATVAAGHVYRAFLGDEPKAFFHGHSYGGNALAAAVALEHLRLIERWRVLDNVRARAEELAVMLTERIAVHPAVRTVRQRGLMAGVELVPSPAGQRLGRRVCAAAVARGVLLRPLGDVVVVMPHLTVGTAELERIVAALEGALGEVFA